MWTMDCGDDHGNEVKVAVSSPIFCQPSPKMNKPSIFSHLVPSEKKLVVQSTRWSPTAEQLMALEELYRHGTRTPTALQIQEITAKLRRFGKIEGKNVFYWFQNHKARDKKKQRLKSALLQSSIIPPKVTTLQVEQTKREPYSNCSTISEEYGSVVPAETPTTHRRIIAQVDHEFQPIIKTEEENQYGSSLNPMKMPFCFPIINLSGTKPTKLISLALDHNKLMERVHHDSPMPNERPGISFFTSIFGSEIRDGTIVQTLELFPLQSENLKGYDQTTSDTSSVNDGDNEAAKSGGGGNKIDLSLALVRTY